MSRLSDKYEASRFEVAMLREENKRLREALRAILAREDSMVWGENTEYVAVMGDMVSIARQALEDQTNG